MHLLMAGFLVGAAQTHFCQSVMILDPTCNLMVDKKGYRLVQGDQHYGIPTAMLGKVPAFLSISDSTIQR